MTRQEHVITELAAQLLRAENPAVIDAVAIQLREEIEKYVTERTAPFTSGTLIAPPAESA